MGWVRACFFQPVTGLFGATQRMVLNPELLDYIVLDRSFHGGFGWFSQIRLNNNGDDDDDSSLY